MIKITENSVAYLNGRGFKYLEGDQKLGCVGRLLGGRECKVVRLASNEKHEYRITLSFNGDIIELPYEYVSAIFLP